MTKSYWQIGCNEAKAGMPFNEAMRYANGYANGFDYGQGNLRPVVGFLWPLNEGEDLLAADPPLKNPYMEAIDNIEGILSRLQTFATEFPKELDSSAVEEYASNLLEVRDRLHDFRQQELALGGA